MSDDIITIQRQYEQILGYPPMGLELIKGSGSARQYFKVGTKPVLIGTIGTDIAENNAFIYLAKHFRDCGLNVPEIVAVSDDHKVYLQQNLGNCSLFDLIQSNSPDLPHYLRLIMRKLPELQFKGAERLDWSKCYPQPEFDRTTVLWDLNYFKYCFLKATGLEFNEVKLEADFQRMASDLSVFNCCFMYRDFQSRNIMIHDGQPWFIDFQGGRRGPFFYDVASFLWQARAGFSAQQREELIAEYLEALKQYINVDTAEFHRLLNKFVLFRTLQVLGAYGFRGYFERKSHFIDSIPAAIDNLRGLLSGNAAVDYPYLNKLLQKLTDRMTRQTSTTDTLTVNVCSFSYKKGLPIDSTGNGGGFVFDCRAIHNPGRYEQYKQLSGLDRPVIEFLESTNEMSDFLSNCYALVDASVERYIERGFTALSVAFGCTGGQHRSVYGAQHMAEHLSSKFNIRVELEHREQGIKRIFIPS